MGRLKGKVAVVTGAGRPGGIGHAICTAFLAEGAKAVVATDAVVWEGAPGPESADEPDNFRFLLHDVSSFESWQELAAQIHDEIGQIDILVNNAGLSIHGGILETSLDDLHKVMSVNHDGIFFGIKTFADDLTEAAKRHPGGGVILNTLSTGSYMPNAHNLAYHCSKAAARMLTICAATELGPRGIRVNSVHPGVTMTPLIRDGIEDYVARGVWENMEAAERGLAGMNALGRLAEPSSIAPLYVYLASEEAQNITGAAFAHDGGFNLHY